MSSSSSSTKRCFNSNCKELLERPRKGWRRRTGEFADLCDRCASAYEEGKFCETFHVSASGWRCCESCGKQIHCGCIVSFHMFVLLDAGGIECITCARKSFILTPNPAWPPPSLLLPLQPERIKDLSLKSWSPIAGSGPVPWRQAPSLFNGSMSQCEVQTKIPFENDASGGIDRLLASERLSSSAMEKRTKEDSFERLSNGGLKIGASDVLENGNTGNCGVQPNMSVNRFHPSSFSKNDPAASPFSLAVTSTSKIETSDTVKVNSTHAPRQTPPFPLVKQVNGHNGFDSSGEAQMRNGRPRGDGRGRTQLLPRYWPRISDQELQQLSGDSNSVITPLFEKMLSASDAGRIGRLVLPKKCAEAYFPPISQPEGLPLKVQDLKGKEWVFQFRFWPNNNSRMYVLEGITPCMQSMQLQAGDIVTFSRMEPEGKLVMGCRKVTTAPSFDQASEEVNTSNGVCPHVDVTIRNAKAGEVVSVPRQSKGSSVLSSFSSINKANFPDPASGCCNVDKSGYVAKEVLETKCSIRGKRKNGTLGFKSKRLRIDNQDMMELKVTLEQVQGLLRPPPSRAPTVVIIDGFEFEEYEDSPIIGRPTIFAADHLGMQVQWAQCGDCFKWRKVHADVILPSKWTCSENSWDPQRSLCSVPEELTYEELADLLPTTKRAASKKMKAVKEDLDSVEALEGLDTLANLAIQEEGELPSASQATTKHPRHRPGCTCIVCIQPPSGKGPKHKHTCKCNVCETVKRRFRTLMSRREKKMSDKEAETTCQKLLAFPDDNQFYCQEGIDGKTEKMMGFEGIEEDPSNGKSLSSPFKGQFDLNIQPERDEDLSPGSDCGSLMRVSQAAARQQRTPSFDSSLDVVDRQVQQDETRVGDFGKGVPIGSSHRSTCQHTIVSSNAPSV